ncbi:MAG: gamma-glutamyltransferase family protein [Caulobacterales bacterium]
MVRALGFPREHSPSFPRRPGPVLARGGMVAAAHPLTVATGLEILQRGGNAVDAAVAAALTASVVMPEMCGLGGDLFAIVYAPGRPPLAFLGSGVAPRAATLDQMRRAGAEAGHPGKMPLQGPLSIGVPGMVDAHGALLGAFGGRPLAELAEPAIRYADQGFALTPFGSYVIGLCKPLLASHPTSAAVFLPGGEAPGVGQILRQPDLARTLRLLAAEGPDAFYSGDLGRRIADFVGNIGGALSAEDLAGHRTVMQPPIDTRYRGHTIWQTGLPSQGLILLEALNIVEQTDSARLAAGDAASIHILAEATKLAFADRLSHALDPVFGKPPLRALLSKDWAARRYAQIDPERAADDAPAGALQDGDTTYLCVADRAGMMVSLIQSVSSAFGSGIVAGDTGVLMNNRVGRGFTLEQGHPNLFAPGKRTMHTLNCYMVADTSGAAVIAGGSPGGDGQPQWNLQALVGLIDSGMDAQAAVEIPRWSIWPGTDPADRPNPVELRVETRLEEAVLADLERRGHRLRRTGAWGGGGAAQIIARDTDSGVLAGGSDPRAEGLALGF